MKQNMINHSNHSARKISVALMLGAGIALVGLTGCGQSSGSSQSPSTADSALEQASAVEPAAAPSAEHGKQLFATTCAGCHGAQGQGVPHLGKDLQHSQFVTGLDNAKLADFITQGRGASDPLNTTHVAMPPKGGNPALSSENIADLVAYIRQLQQTQTAAK